MSTRVSGLSADNDTSSRDAAPRLYAARQQVLDQAFVAHPERFARRHPTPPAVPVQVGINLPKPTPRVPGEPQRSTLNPPQLVSQSC
jgi:putative transposase